MLEQQHCRCCLWGWVCSHQSAGWAAGTAPPALPGFPGHSRELQVNQQCPTAGQHTQLSVFSLVCHFTIASIFLQTSLVYQLIQRVFIYSGRPNQQHTNTPHNHCQQLIIHFNCSLPFDVLAFWATLSLPFIYLCGWMQLCTCYMQRVCLCLK